MKRGKRHFTDGVELPNQDIIRTLREKETKKYFDILETDTRRDERKKLGKSISGEPESYTNKTI